MDRANFGIKDKAGKANFVTKYDCKIQEMLEKKLSEILPEAEFWGGMVCNILVFLMLLYGMISK